MTTTLTLSDLQGIDPLTATVSDLRRADGAALIPAASIQVQPSMVSVPTNAPESIALTVNFADAPASGEFAGSLYLYHQGGRQVVPLLVRVKTAPLLPWAFMVVGVLLGTGLSRYRAEGRSRDELVVQVGRLRNQMRADPELDENFQASIESELVDVFSALEDRDWETAKSEIVEAKNLWKRWCKYRDDWIAQLEYGETQVAEEFQKLPEHTRLITYMQEVKKNIDDLYRKLKNGQYKEPQELSVSFSEIRKQINQYKEGETAIENLRERCKDLPREKAKSWLGKFDLMESRLHKLSPDQDSYQKWQLSLDEVSQKLEEEISASMTNATSEVAITGRSSTTAIDFNPIPSAPYISVPGQPNDNDIERSQTNLRWFDQASLVVAIVFLAWLGMTELYANKPTFGADPMRDYFTLLAWGFGAELTRESIVKASQGVRNGIE
ncbi:MAG: hypothetical protein HC929_24840 [Leptolyngbyaceae cyanobacterium SM2_5_2]|nr:hypothetical protein [Leptolyngbyaceae cyanobacterium SM2_5_2]